MKAALRKYSFDIELRLIEIIHFMSLYTHIYDVWKTKRFTASLVHKSMLIIQYERS